MKLFAVSPPGLEALVAREVQALGHAGAQAVPGGVEWEADEIGMMRANLLLRTPNRVLLRLGGFRATSFKELFAAAARLPWERWVGSGVPVAFRVSCHRSRLYHSGAVAERLLDALARRVPGVTAIAAAPQAGEGDAESDGAQGPAPAQLVLARVDHDQVQVSLDSSGELLSRRGWRQQTAKAPLRENLAAALLLHAGWRGQGTLIDPFCGAGTLAIEALEVALNLPAGRLRGFAFQRWPSFDAGAWAMLRHRALAEARTTFPGRVLASDHLEGALRAARGNAERAGVAQHLPLEQADFFKVTPPDATGLLVANLPYGRRVADRTDTARLLRNVGARLASAWGGWDLGLMIARDRRPGAAPLGLAGAACLDCENGGLPVRLVRLEATTRSA
jgi:putative N6-adenine-specific DNA methylase